eukprot:2988858-Alexandrium_andersonii.AAC.1
MFWRQGRWRSSSPLTLGQGSSAKRRSLWGRAKGQAWAVLVRPSAFGGPPAKTGEHDEGVLLPAYADFPFPVLQ